MEGTQIGPYRVLGDLGSGGMGKVYLAEVAGKAPGLDVGLRVALKVIHPHLLETPGFFKRFLREAEIGKSVEQDNVVRCFDCDAVLYEGVQQNFLVMEYVEGQTLRDLLSELERVPEELCRHIGREIAKGLQAIHEAGVIHRDLKPENVLITEDHVVKVMDLGVARLQDEAIRLSQTGAFVGSLEYASPEQFRSGGSDVDARSDLHALGVMLYELSTGQHPYRTDDVSSTLRNVIDGEVRRAGEVNPQLSPFFEEVVHRLAAKEPGERFASASILLTVLEDGEKSEWWQERAKALRIQTKRPLRRIRIPRETALYGRDDDLARLHALYEKAQAGDGQVLLIEGEAGIGKTRLVDEFVGRLRQEGEDINFLFGSYPPGGAATAAGAFSTAYREQFGAEGLVDTLKEYLTVTPVLIPSFAALLRGETTPTGAEPLTKDSLQTVFTHATRALAAERPTIVLIDDLHFAPEDGRALFASLALAVPEHRILLVGTMRPGVPGEWLAGITRLDHAEQRSLSRLGSKDLARLLDDAFHSERLARDLGHQIALKSDGNPFFAFEIIRGLREGQFIAQQPDGTWVTTKVIQDIQVPSSVQDLVQARIADLGVEDKNLLDLASCCGLQFDPQLVARGLGMGAIPGMQRLAWLEKRHRLVRSSGRKFVFDHHQVQEALYGALPPQLREAYHAAIAEALEARAGAVDKDPKDLDGPLCVDLCEHYLKGGQGERALRYLDVALDHLGSCFLNDQAIALADRALAVPDLLHGEGHMRVLLRKNDRLDLLGRRALQGDVLDEARVLAEALGEKKLWARVEWAVGVLHAKTGRSTEAREHLERCLVLAQEIGDREGEVRAADCLGFVDQAQGRCEEARAHYERNLAYAEEIGDRLEEANARGNLGNVDLSQSCYSEARAHYRRSLALAQEIGDRRLEAIATGNLGSAQHEQGRYAKARAHFERNLALAQAIGDRQGEAIATGNLGLVDWAQGHYAAARDHHEQHLAMSREIGDRQGEAVVLLNLGPLWQVVGDPRRAREALEASLALCRAVGAPYPEGYALLGLSGSADEEGDRARALARASESLALRREIGHGGGVVDSLIQVGGLYWRAGDVGAAKDALAEAVTLARGQQRKAAVAEALAVLANLPGGDIAAAEAALQDAGEGGNTPQVRYHLWKASGKHEHLAEAKRLLDHLVEHAPEEYRESMRKNVRLHREILEAWEEHGGERE